jgi:hypothetical protein
VSARDRGDRIVTAVGAVLLVAYVAQAALSLELPALVALQAETTYKVGSGCVLAAYLLVQWSLGTRRLYAQRAVVRHKVYGALAPVFLYLHATRFAWGYLVWLSAVYLGNVALGLVHRPVVRTPLRRFFAAWFVTHVVLSVILLLLGCYHVAVALAYE